MSSRGADLLVQSLVRAGTRYVFTVSGNHIMPVFDAALDAKLELVHVRHEAAAVHMADAWARVTGEVGVAMVTGGPGHANAVSALYTALASQSPVVLLSGHAALSEVGRGAFQEMRQADMAVPATKASWTANSADELGELIARAMRVARSGWPGPVHISLPADVLESNTDVAPPGQEAFTPELQTVDDALMASLLHSLRAARRPLIIAGPCFASVPNTSLVRRISDAVNVPVVTMESPRGINDASLGLFPEVLKHCDVALLLGKRRDFTLKFGDALAPQCHVLELPQDVSPVIIAERLLDGSTADASRADWTDEVRHALRYRPAAWSTIESPPGGPLHALSVCAELQGALDGQRDAILVADGGEFCQWVQGAVSPPHRIINGPAGAIGPGLPFALAAKLARPDSLVIATTGDGTFGFHMSEFDTAVRYGLPVVVVIGNDACWNAEHQIQLRTYGAARAHGCELLPSRYDGVAQALGAHAEYVQRRDELAPALARAIASRRPACINVALQRIAAPRIVRG